MKHYGDAFLGMILAGVVMMVVGLGLIISPAYFQPTPATLSSELPPKQMALSERMRLGEARQAANTR